MIDRDTALAILKELSGYMRPSYDLFGRKTLVIDRYRFEEIRKKYLDRQKEELTQSGKTLDCNKEMSVMRKEC